MWAAAGSVGGNSILSIEEDDDAPTPLRGPPCPSPRVPAALHPPSSPAHHFLPSHVQLPGAHVPSAPADAQHAHGPHGAGDDCAAACSRHLGRLHLCRVLSRHQSSPNPHQSRGRIETAHYKPQAPTSLPFAPTIPLSLVVSVIPWKLIPVMRPRYSVFMRKMPERPGFDSPRGRFFLLRGPISIWDC